MATGTSFYILLIIKILPLLIIFLLILRILAQCLSIYNIRIRGAGGRIFIILKLIIVKRVLLKFLARRLYLFNIIKIGVGGNSFTILLISKLSLDLEKGVKDYALKVLKSNNRSQIIYRSM